MNNNNRKYIILALIVAFAIVLTIFFITLNNRKAVSSSYEEPISQPGKSSEYYVEEDEDMQNTYVKHDPSDFMGDWTATSNQTEYIFGNIDLTIYENGSWIGNVADTELEGTWQEADDGIRLHCSNFDYIYYTIAYTDDNIVVLRRDDDARAVIIRK